MVIKISSLCPRNHGIISVNSRRGNAGAERKSPSEPAADSGVGIFQQENLLASGMVKNHKPYSLPADGPGERRTIKTIKTAVKWQGKRNNRNQHTMGRKRNLWRKTAGRAAALAAAAVLAVTASGCGPGWASDAAEFASRLKAGMEASQAEQETQTAQIAAAADPVTGETSYDFLLVGTDRRQKNWNGNSDVMLLATVNYNQKTIVLTSFMRDLGVEIPGVGFGKLNSAYARGGISLLVSTLTSVFQVDVDNYAIMDFDDAAALIDDYGGVDAAVTTAEAESLNQNLHEMGNLYGFDADAYAVAGRDDGGTVHLNGYQAVAYARIRHVGNSDYERTSRQREVLTSFLGKFKDASLTEMLDAVGDARELMTTDLTDDDAGAMLQRYLTARTYTVIENRVPYDGYYTSQDENLIPDLDYTISMLQQMLYQ